LEEIVLRRADETVSRLFFARRNMSHGYFLVPQSVGSDKYTRVQGTYSGFEIISAPKQDLLVAAEFDGNFHRVINPGTGRDALGIGIDNEVLITPLERFQYGVQRMRDRAGIALGTGLASAVMGGVLGLVGYFTSWEWYPALVGIVADTCAFASAAGFLTAGRIFRQIRGPHVIDAPKAVPPADPLELRPAVADISEFLRRVVQPWHKDCAGITVERDGSGMRLVAPDGRATATFDRFEVLHVPRNLFPDLIMIVGVSLGNAKAGDTPLPRGRYLLWSSTEPVSGFASFKALETLFHSSKKYNRHDDIFLQWDIKLPVGRCGLDVQPLLGDGKPAVKASYEYLYWEGNNVMGARGNVREPLR
jgi:hypothetical protein